MGEGKADPSLKTPVLTRWGNSEPAHLTPFTGSDPPVPKLLEGTILQGPIGGNDDNLKNSHIKQPD